MSWTDEFKDGDFKDIVTEQVSLAERTSLGIGGAADWLAEPTSVDQLVALVACCHENDLPVRVLGGGANLLIRDEGVRGVVISLTADAFHEIAIAECEVTCGGGAKLADLISETVGTGLGGLETLVGIPGTVGGALHSNAGGHGGDIGQWATGATAVTRTGEVVRREKNDLVFAYQQSSLDELAIVSATFTLENTSAQERESPEALAKRMQKQWIAAKAVQPMAHEHSIYAFKDPRGMSAETLIEQAGLKSASVGNAEVCSRHANYIVAQPGATVADVLALVEKIREEVMSQTGIELKDHFKTW